MAASLFMVASEGKFMALAIIGECMMELSQNKEGSTKNYNLGYGGDTLNVALYFARWKGRVEYVTALGDDPFSEAMYDDWKIENIGVKLVQRIPNRQSGLYMVKTNDSGERSFYYWRDNSPARDLFELENCATILNDLMSFKYIYFSGITLSLYSQKSLDIFYNFLKKYKLNGGQIIFDLNYRPAGWKNNQEALDVFNRFIPLVNIALPSEDDEQLLTGQGSPEKIIERYLNFGVSEIVVKCGERGCVLHHQNITKKILTEVIDNPVDTTAAGDGFNGGYLAARIAGINCEQAVLYGQKCASRIVQYPGAIIPRSEWPKDYIIEIL